MKYKVELFHTNEGYSVGCPELRGCWSEGKTEEEAITNIKSAIADYPSVVREMNPEEEFEKKVVFVDVPEGVSGEDSSNRSIIKPFKVISIPMGFPPGGSYDKVEDQLDILEGPDRLY